MTQKGWVSIDEFEADAGVMHSKSSSEGKEAHDGGGRGEGLRRGSAAVVEARPFVNHHWSQSALNGDEMLD